MKHVNARRPILLLLVLSLVLSILPVTAALAWTDEAHMAMGLAAGYKYFHNCVAPDISRKVAEINSLTQTDESAHYYNAPFDHVITVADAYTQLQAIGQPPEDFPDGHLLGAILQATRICKEKTAAGDYDDPYYAVLLHYVADLTNPLHLSPYDDFNRSYHFACDHILSDDGAEYPVVAAMALADELTVDDELSFETEEQMLEGVIALAAQSQALGKVMWAEQRNITREEALLQLSRAASLGRAIMRYCGKLK